MWLLFHVAMLYCLLIAFLCGRSSQANVRVNFGPSFIKRHEIYGANAVSELQPMNPEDRKVRRSALLCSVYLSVFWIWMCLWEDLAEGVVHCVWDNS